MKKICPDCGHDVYWHEQRRADDPLQFHPGPCLCGCRRLVIVSWEHPLIPHDIKGDKA